MCAYKGREWLGLEGSKATRYSCTIFNLLYFCTLCAIHVYYICELYVCTINVQLSTGTWWSTCWPVLRSWTVLCTAFVNYMYYTCVQKPDGPPAGLCYDPGLYYVLYLWTICTIHVYRNLMVHMLSCATSLDCNMYCLCGLYVLYMCTGTWWSTCWPVLRPLTGSWSAVLMSPPNTDDR